MVYPQTMESQNQRLFPPLLLTLLLVSFVCLISRSPVVARSDLGLAHELTYPSLYGFCQPSVFR